MFTLQGDEGRREVQPQPSSQERLAVLVQGMHEPPQEANKERVAKASRQWELQNRQRVRENRRRWMGRNPSYMAKYLAKWHYENPEKLGEYLQRSKERHPEKIMARNALNKAIRRGEVEKPDNCGCCEKERSGRELHAHHDDYEKPLEVRWLCRGCHNALHVALRDAETRSQTPQPEA